MTKNILIVGAGITGLTLAALLEKQGIVPTVVDKANAKDSTGYGITIMPGGLSGLEPLGITADMKAVGGELRACKLYNEQGKLLNSFGLSEAGVHSVTLSRGDLIGLISKKLTKTKVLWNTSVTKISHDQSGAVATFTNGKKHHFNLVIGADGINSHVRSLLFPEVTAKNVGAAIWMLSLPAGCPLPDTTSGQLIWGTSRFMAVFPYQNTAAVAFTMPLAPHQNPGSITVKEAFWGMSPLGDKILAHLNEQQMYRGHLKQIGLKNWYKNLVVLAGDAAHAMVPATGMGASNGIQDAAVLAKLIADMPVELFDMLPKQYQKLRKESVDKKQRQAYMLGRMMLLNKYQARLRDHAFSAIPPSVLGRAMVRQ